MRHIAIIGNGISGVTAARHIRKRDSNCRITIISSETEYFYSRTALMYIYMGHMTFKHTQPYEPRFWKENRIDLKQVFVNEIDFAKKELLFNSDEPMTYDDLILATGSKSNKFGWKGQDLDGVQGLYSYQDLELLEENTKNIKHAVIIGGGLIGIELAEMLHSRNIHVTFLIREQRFWNGVLPDQDADLVTRHILSYGIDLKTETELEEIVADKDGRVSKIITKSGETIDCQFVGLTAGVSPNIEFLKSSTLAVDRGILVDEFCKTNIDNVFAIGDCAQFKNPVSGRRNLEQVWYTGKIMGETVAKTITGSLTKYNPGNWFNSAKFFDIEYQTYGWVFSKLRENESEFYWEHESGKMCLHFVFETDSKKFLGVNSFGIRLRHHAFDNWLNEAKSIQYVLEHLKDANFDPEFYKQYEEEIIAKFNSENNENLVMKKKSWKRILSFSK